MRSGMKKAETHLASTLISFPFLNTPCNVFGNAAAFFLRKARHDREEQLALAIEGVDALLLEVAFYTMLFERSDGGQAVYGISGETADGLGHDQVYFSSQRVRNHLIEAIPVAGIQAADAEVKAERGGHGVLGLVPRPEQI